MKIALAALVVGTGIGTMAITLCAAKKLCALQKSKNNGTEKLCLHPGDGKNRTALK